MISSSLIAASLMLGGVNPAFSVDEPFYYNSGNTLPKDQLVFPIVLSASPGIFRRNTAFGLTDRVSLETSMLLYLPGFLGGNQFPNLRVKLLLLKDEFLIASFQPECLYMVPDAQSGDRTILGGSLPITARLGKGRFLTVTPSYRVAVEGTDGLSQEALLALGINSFAMDIDYLYVVDPRSALAISAHMQPASSGTDATVFAGKFEYLRGVGKTTRLGFAMLYNPLWVDLSTTTEFKFLPQLSLWWQFPVVDRLRGKSRSKGRFKAAQKAAAPTP